MSDSPFIEPGRNTAAPREGERPYGDLFDNNHAVMLIVDPEGGAIVDANPAAIAYYGWPRETLLRMRIAEINTLPPEEVQMEMNRARAEQRTCFLFRHRRADGSVRDVEVYSGPISMKGRTLLFSIIHDITRQKRAEESLKRQNAYLDTLNDMAIGLMQRMDLADLFRSIMARAAALFKAEEGWISVFDFDRGDGEFKAVVGPNAHLIGTRFDAGRGIVGEVLRTGRTFLVENYSTWPGRANLPEYDARRATVAVPLRYQSRLAGILGLAHHDDALRFDPEDLAVLERVAELASIALDNARLYDRMKGELAERKKAEAALQQEIVFKQRLLENSPVFIVAIGADGKTLMMNRVMLEFVGYSAAEAEGRDYLETFVPEEDRDGLREIFRKILQSNKKTVSENRIIGRSGRTCLVELHGHPMLNPEGTIDSVVGVGIDITERRRSEEALLSTTERLRQVLGGTVQAISMAVETRDPYTAGHQKKTSDLARAIATEMGFEAGRIDFIRMAASIHDIGKVAVPAEFLSKPTKLTPIEFSLIKVHAQAGYEILKDIDFPWPVAEVVRQHHERMDGSGYPRGLRGGEILLEASILAVADVVESMASHRPYRPALGIDAAMDELRTNRGVLYDAEVADACLRLFRERGYRMN